MHRPSEMSSVYTQEVGHREWGIGSSWVPRVGTLARLRVPKLKPYFSACYPLENVKRGDHKLCPATTNTHAYSAPATEQGVMGFPSTFGWPERDCQPVNKWKKHPENSSSQKSFVSTPPHFLFFLNFLVPPCGMQDLSSLTRDRTLTPCSGNEES